MLDAVVDVVNRWMQLVEIDLSQIAGTGLPATHRVRAKKRNPLLFENPEIDALIVPFHMRCSVGYWPGPGRQKVRRLGQMVVHGDKS